MKRCVYTDRRRNLKTIIIIISALVLSSIILVKTDKAIRPALKSVCEDECRAYASGLIGNTIQKTLERTPYDYNDFAELIMDENGNIKAVETHTGNVNRFQTEILTEINNSLDKGRNAELSVSLGTASGVWIFAGRGPSVPMRFMPIGSADVKLKSVFEEAGINQTCHKLLIEVSVHVAGTVPLCRTEADVKYEYLLAETVIMGNVPEKYTVLKGE